MYDLSGKVAVVTGASGRRGIGRAIAIRLAREGADVVVTDIMKPPHPDDAEHEWHGIDSVVKEIESMGRRAIGLYSDVTDASQVHEMVERAVNTLGKIDIFVANAGSQPGGDRKLLVDLEEDAFDLVQRVNVKGTFLSLREVSRHMIARGGPGKIITMSSRAGKQGTARYAAYCASKFAVIGMTQALALELAPYKVNVNAICPGLVDTERVYFMADALRPEDVSVNDYRQTMLDERSRATPLGRPRRRRRHRQHRCLPRLRPVGLPHRPFDQRLGRQRHDLGRPAQGVNSRPARGTPEGRRSCRSSDLPGRSEGQSDVQARRRHRQGCPLPC